MTKTIEDYTVDELSAKINAIKAEREKTANALKLYEEELERRKNKNWLPLTPVLYSAKYESEEILHVEFKAEITFNNYSCFYKYREYLEEINKNLVANSKSEPIDIKVLLPLLKKGWVAYEKEYGWVWFNNKPFILRGTEKDKTWSNEGSFGIIAGFKLKPAENWETSLMECGL